MTITQYKAQLLSIDDNQFEHLALEVFEMQYHANTIYRRFCDLLQRKPTSVRSIYEIPFLPVDLYKTHSIRSSYSHSNTPDEATPYFETSSTTGQVPGRHYVPDLAWYDKVSFRIFEEQWGKPSQYCILALLPSYLEREHSSLVHMTQMLMKASDHIDNGFYLHDTNSLSHKLAQLEAQGQKTLLLGVTYALLDFATQYPMPLSHCTVMETGGMKGRKQEWTRSQVHQHLSQAFNLPFIATEYGMTELLSQAYAKAEGIYSSPPWMRILLRDINDPQEVGQCERGLVNIIDLANIDSCCFVATQDIGVLHNAHRFEILGRADYAELRGCSLLSV